MACCNFRDFLTSSFCGYGDCRIFEARAFQMVRGKSTWNGLEFVFAHSILESKLLRLNKHNYWWGEQPKENSSKALIYTLILVVLSYFFPILIGTSSVPINDELWTKGYFSEIAKILRGNSLRWWIHAASTMSNMGMFLAEMSNDSFLLLCMAERGMLLEFFGKRSRHGTPMIGILISTSSVLLLSLFSFQEIVATENISYTVLEQF